MKHIGETFVDQRIDLTGGHFENCRFDGCILELTEQRCYLDGNNFFQCEMIGAGWPEDILFQNRLMQAALSRKRATLGPWRDLQTQWKPATFRWGMVRMPWVPEPNAMCFCMGPQTPAQVYTEMCACEWAMRYGVEFFERMLIR